MLAILLWGCGEAEFDWDSFAADHAHAQCLVYKQCYRAHFDGEYETMSRCKESLIETRNQERQDVDASCEFVEAKAQECLDVTYSSTCGEHWTDQSDIYLTCYEEVWSCSPTE